MADLKLTPDERWFIDFMCDDLMSEDPSLSRKEAEQKATLHTITARHLMSRTGGTNG